MRFRAGTKLGRTIYVQLGDEPSKLDPVVGMMDSPDWAAIVVAALNVYAGATWMPWHVVENHSDCPAAKPHGVVKNDGNELVACHKSTASAKMQIAIMREEEGSEGA